MIQQVLTITPLIWLDVVHKLLFIKILKKTL